jgi:hypothetical protein
LVAQRHPKKAINVNFLPFSTFLVFFDGSTGNFGCPAPFIIVFYLGNRIFWLPSLRLLFKLLIRKDMVKNEGEARAFCNK